MANRWKTMGTGHARGVWPVLLVLLAAVLVPTACVLWFMNAAMRNESLAVRQKLTDIYQADASEIQESLEQYFLSKVEALQKLQDSPSPQVFADCVRGGLADSVIIFDDAGKLAYPTTEISVAARPGELSDQWQQAQELEFKLTDNNKAGLAYAKIAKETNDINEKASALQAQVRCLLKAGHKPLALLILTSKLIGEDLRLARHSHGRMIAPSAMLLALQLEDNRESSEFTTLAQRLAGRLNNYAGPLMTSSQRRFLIRQLMEIYPQAGVQIMLKAEDLAAGYLQAKPSGADPSRILPANLLGSDLL